MPRLKRLRYRLKPLVVLDEDMLREFEACIGLSDATERFFAPRGVPFLWMPGGCRKDPIPEPGPAALSTDRRGPVRFGYFGALADHSGIRALVEAHRKLDIDAELHVCGYGRLSDWVAAAAALDPRMHWHGLRPSQEDCLRLAQGWDVLVNPRPASHGNENNFPSKLFEYAACGRAILTTDLSGSGRVLGPEAFYMKASCLPAELELQLAAIARLPRAELARKGKLLQERVRAGYSWPIQVERMIRFMGQVKDLPARS
jgi:glycosyltransferase involved in cell wall biosynthesis